MLRIKWLARARKDIKDEKDFISKDNPQIAVTVIQHIYASAENIRQYPDIGRIGRVSNTRELKTAKYQYIIAYRVVVDTVEVLRVLHARQKYPQ